MNNSVEKKCAYKCICNTEQIKIKRNENLKKNIGIKNLCENCEDNEEIQNLKKVI